MLNVIWLGMIFISIIVGIIEGNISEVVHAVTESAKVGFELALGLTGMMAFWLGIMSVATESGLIRIFAKLLKPIMRWLFPEVPADHPAMGAMVMNISANMLGLGNAATPFGLQAMKELQTLNNHVSVATNAMCTFLAVNTSSVQLIPATAIAFLAANGSTNPSSIILSSFIATVASTAAAIIAVKHFSKWRLFNVP